MKILVTGSNGLLGFQVVSFLKNKHNVIPVIRSSAMYSNSGFKYYVCNLSNDYNLKDLPKSVDVIIHLAQSPHYRQFPEKADDVFQVNCRATANLLNYALKAGVKQFIYASSGSVYEPYQGDLVEEAAISPESFYANSKLIGESLVRSYQSYFKITILRLFFLYGPHPNEKQTLINNLIRRVSLEAEVIIDGDSEGMVFVPTATYDVAKCISTIIDKEIDGLFNLANNQSISILQAVDTISDFLRIKPKICYSPEKKPLSIIPCIKKIKSVLPDIDFMSFYDGIKALMLNSVSVE